jgi:anti-sigma factor RsiW
MSDRLTFDELRAYQTGQLSGPARYRVERVLLEDPFYADALAGLEAMQQAARPTPEQLTSLRVALQDRIHASATKKRLWHLWIATITAALLFVFAVAIYMIYFMPKKVIKPARVVPPTSLKAGSGAAFSKTTIGEISYWQTLI